MRNIYIYISKKYIRKIDHTLNDDVDLLFVVVVLFCLLVLLPLEVAI